MTTILYYQELENGDYLAIEPDTNAYYQKQGRDHFQGRSCAIANEVESVCTTGIPREFLKEKCLPVARANVPTEWLHAIGYHHRKVTHDPA